MKIQKTTYAQYPRSRGFLVIHLIKYGYKNSPPGSLV